MVRIISQRQIVDGILVTSAVDDVMKKGQLIRNITEDLEKKQITLGQYVKKAKAVKSHKINLISSHNTMHIR